MECERDGECTCNVRFSKLRTRSLNAGYGHTRIAQAKKEVNRQTDFFFVFDSLLIQSQGKSIGIGNFSVYRASG